MSERYEIRGKVGRGGMSAVYRGYDTVMKREVAIKRLLPVEETNLNEETIGLLEKEAAALSRFQHPNIVTIFALEEDAEGGYVVMEMIEGQDLHSVMETGALPWEDFLDIVPQCLEPLMVASELGLLHRDIKPGNIMLTMTAADRFLVKILDFGLAKFSMQPSLQTLDQQGSFLGSIDYIAPEQLELKPLDQRTDLYSLGCVLYYALTQKAPFSGDNPARTSMNHLRHRCRHISELRDDITEPVAEWLMRMISREVEDRPKNAEDALEQFHLAVKGVSSVADGEAVGAVPVARIVEPEVAAGSSPIIAPAGDVLPPGEEEDDVPFAQVAEMPKKPLIATRSVEPSAPTILTTTQKPVGEKARPSVSVPPPRAPIKKVKASDPSLNKWGMVLVMGLGLFVIGLFIWGGKRRDPVIEKTTQPSRQPIVEAIPKAKSQRAAFSVLPLPTKLIWRKSGSAPMILPVTDGLVSRFAAGHHSLSRDYRSPAKVGGQVAAWGDLVTEKLSRSMVRDGQDQEGTHLPVFALLDLKEIRQLHGVQPGLVLDKSSSLTAQKNGLGTVEAMTVIVVAKFVAGSEKLVRITSAEKSEKFMFLSLNKDGQLQANIRSGASNSRVFRKWGSARAGVVSFVWSAKSKKLSLQAIGADGGIVEAVSTDVEVPKMPMTKVAIGSRDFQGEGERGPGHVLFELILYNRALGAKELELVVGQLKGHYFPSS